MPEQPIFRDYDRAGLDAQYNNRARVPDHGDMIQRWVRDSEAIRARQREHGRVDVAYGSGARELLDLFIPDKAPAGGAPVLAFIHGGYWQALDKNAFSFLAAPFLDAGIAVAMLGYPLAPGATMDQIVESIRAGLAWLWRNAAAHSCDAGRIHVAGHSAGGHLTAMALLTDWASRDGLPAGLVQGGCAISGLYELEPIRLCYLNEALSLDADTARRNGPSDLLGAAEAPKTPLILTVGGDESPEFLRQQADFAESWKNQGGHCDTIVMEGDNHFTILDRLADRESPLHRAVRDQILG
ncbi:MAG: alpha/beta hydrolase [Alphaproteobacteria bacterium]